MLVPTRDVTITLAHYDGALTSKFPDLPEKARKEAEQHRPPTEALALDHNEIAVQVEAEKAMAREQQLFQHMLTDASKSAYELRQKLPDLEGRIQQTISDQSLAAEAATELAEERATLVAATIERLKAEVDLRAFRARHNITEQAEYPESRWWHFGIVVGMALLETIINAVFYENTQGLLGGFVVAASVSLINMLVAVLLGIGFQFKNLSDKRSRYLGWACLTGFVVVAIYCNALFASFRAAYQLVADPSDVVLVRNAFAVAAEQAGRVFLLRMKFGDLMSFILFGVGLVLSWIAFQKGYTSDDKHPGHGKKDRAARAARESEQAVQETARQKLKEFLQRRRRELQAISREPAEIMNAAGARTAELQHGNTLFLSQQDAVQRDFALLLRSYRNANATIRGTPPPTYFAIVPDLRTGLDSGVLESVLAIFGQVHTAAQSLRDRFHDALSAKLNDMQRDTAVLLDATFASFVRSVEQEAEEAINRSIITVQRASPSRQMTNA